MPRVTVVIPAYNAEHFLAETVQSALNSTFRDLEVVIVNDGSKDGTQAVAESFLDRVTVINQINAGMSPSRNTAIDSSDSEFIALLDSDDVWHPYKVAAQISALESRPQYGFSFSAFEFWGGQPKPGFATESRTGKVDPDFDGWIYHRLIVENWALPSSVLFRRAAWHELGPFLCDDYKTDDWEYLVRASRHFKFVRLHEPMVLYRQHPQSLSNGIVSRPVGELMRAELIRRYGTASPDGQQVDHAALDRETWFGWVNFADAHCARGDLALGLRTFGSLLVRGPERKQTSFKLAKSLFRRAFPRIGKSDLT